MALISPRLLQPRVLLARITRNICESPVTEEVYKLRELVLQSESPPIARTSSPFRIYTLSSNFRTLRFSCVLGLSSYLLSSNNLRVILYSAIGKPSPRLEILFRPTPNSLPRSPDDLESSELRTTEGMASGNGNAVATIAGIQASDHRYHVAKKEEQLAILKAAGRLDNVVARYGKVPIKVAGVKTIELREWCELAQETLPIIHKKPQAASKRIEDIDYDIQLVRGGMDEYKMEVNEYGLAAADSGYDIDLLNGMTDKVLETYSRAQGRRPLKSDGIERFRRSLRAALRNQQLENLPNTVFSDQLPGWFVDLCRQCLLALDTDKKCTLNTIGSAIEALAKERGELRTQLARTRNNIIQAS